MSDTDEMQGIALELPEREITQIASRKTTYEVGKVNVFPFDLDGEEKTGYFRFERARLIAVTGRVQQTRNTKALVVTQGIIIDNPEIGMLGEGDTLVPHPMHTDPRYAAWQASQRPKRINAQQWVQPQNRDLVMEYVNYLHDKHDFSITQRPSRREGSQRKTEDLFVARPSNGRNLPQDDRSNYGVALNAFEVSVNPDYEQGFKDFVSGLEEQRMRWEGAFEIEDEDLRRQALEQIAQNIHFLGGVYRDEEARTWWARPVDVGMVNITDPENRENRDWALYQQRGTKLNEGLFSQLDEPATAGATAAPTGGVSVSSLSLPDSDEDDF